MVITPRWAGQDLNAEDINTNLDETLWSKVQLSDQFKTANTTLVATELIYSLPANTQWVFTSCFMYTAGTAGDIKVQIDIASAGVNFLRVAQWLGGTGIAATANSITHSALDSATAVLLQAGGIGTGSLMTMIPSGYITVGNGVGTLTVSFAQNTSNASTTTFKLGSFMQLARVA